MVNFCCICKLTQGEIKAVSFHSLPKDEVRKQQWLTIINRKVTKTSRVCSRHFKKTDFQYKIINEKIFKTVLPHAIPSFETNVNRIDDTVEHSTETDFGVGICSKENIDHSTGQGQLTYLNVDVKQEKDDVESNGNIKLNDDSNDSVNLNIKKEASLESEDTEYISNSRAVKTLRYIGDLGPEHFKSMKAYQIVKNYHETTKKHLKNKNKTIDRLRTKVAKFQNLTDQLRDPLKNSEIITKKCSKVSELS